MDSIADIIADIDHSFGGVLDLQHDCFGKNIGPFSYKVQNVVVFTNFVGR